MKYIEPKLHFFYYYLGIKYFKSSNFLLSITPTDYFDTKEYKIIIFTSGQ